MSSFCDATRVFFDAMFPEVLRIRSDMLGEDFGLGPALESPESVA